MHVQGPISVGPPAADLLARLRAWSNGRLEQTHLLLVSVSVLPIAHAPADFWMDLGRALLGVKARHNARPFDLGGGERALLITLNEYNQLTVATDLRLELLRLIQRHFPDHFGMVDQSRLLRVIDLRTKLSNAIAFLERMTAGATAVEAAPAPTVLRPLQGSDIRMIEDLFRQLGAENFARAFIRGQMLAEISAAGTTMPVMSEHFVSMDMLKRHVFKGVELRGAGNLFNQLTIALDQVLLGSFAETGAGAGACSVNLNVESVFTRGFENFLAEVDDAVLANIMFEFRQANILQHFDEFEVACNVIRSRGGRIAVDAVFPETVGIVNLNRLHASIAKIFWRQGAETSLPKARDDIRRLQDGGARLALVRLDDETGIEIGHDLGISLFQGFYVDRLLQTAVASAAR